MAHAGQWPGTGLHPQCNSSNWLEGSHTGVRRARGCMEVDIAALSEAVALTLSLVLPQMFEIAWPDSRGSCNEQWGLCS